MELFHILPKNLGPSQQYTIHFIESHIISVKGLNKLKLFIERNVQLDIVYCILLFISL